MLLSLKNLSCLFLKETCVITFQISLEIKAGNFFEYLGIDHSFLNFPTTNWQQQERFRLGEEIVNNLHVTNDPAERAVKLCSDFFDTCKSEEKLQCMFQGASDNIQ